MLTKTKAETNKCKDKDKNKGAHLPWGPSWQKSLASSFGGCQGFFSSSLRILKSSHLARRLPVHIRVLPTKTISSVTSVCQRIKLPRALSFEPITQSLAWMYVLGFLKLLQRWESYFQRSFSYPHCGVADMSACVIMPDYYGHLNYHGWLWSPTSATIQYNLLVLQDMSWNSEC